VSDEKLVGSSRWQGAWLPLFGSLVLFLLILPTVIVIPMSFSDSAYLEFPPQQWSLRWYREYFGSAEWMSATWTSLQAAVLTTLIATPLGTLAAYGMSGLSERLRNGLQLIVLTPLVVPVILVAVGVFHLYAKLGLNYTLAGVVIAHVALALPFVVITVMSGLKGYDFTLSWPPAAWAPRAHERSCRLPYRTCGFPSKRQRSWPSLLRLTRSLWQCLSQAGRTRRSLGACSMRCAIRSTRPSPPSRPA